MKQSKNFSRAKFKRIASLTSDLLYELCPEEIVGDLLDTHLRVAGFWDEFLGYSDDNINTTFEVIESDQLVAVTGIEFFSLCSHHLLPFFVIVRTLGGIQAIMTMWGRLYITKLRKYIRLKKKSSQIG